MPYYQGTNEITDLKIVILQLDAENQIISKFSKFDKQNFQSCDI